MPMPVRSLPVAQNWSCHGCGDCCRTYHVRVTAGEKTRLDALGWAADPELKGEPPVVRDGPGGDYRLNHTPDGACVFLGPDNRCRIHAQHGAAAKPMACRIYPFVLVPAGDHWRAGVRFACPSAAANRGEPLAAQLADAGEYAGLLEAEAAGPVAGLPPPPLGGGQSLPWPDLLRLMDKIDDLLADPREPIDRRVRQVAAFAGMCRKLSFAKLGGPDLRKFLAVVAAAAAEETPASAGAVSPPTWVGRTIFRQIAAIYCRKDNGPDAGVAKRSRLLRIRAAWRFARGTGEVPRLYGRIPGGVRFEAAERPTGGVAADAGVLLSRYLRVKVQSGQFFGPTNFHLGFWDGLDALLLTFPIILWLARVMGSGEPGGLSPRSVESAVRIVDDNFGFNPLLGAARQRWAVAVLAERGEISKLAGWYGR